MLENPNLISGIYLEGNRYMIRVVKELDKEELFKLFIEHFCPREPLRAAMFKKFPEKRHHDFAYWDIVKTHYTDEIFGKGMCVGCFDSQNNFEMVGATLVKGSNFSRYDLMKEN